MFRNKASSLYNSGRALPGRAFTVVRNKDAFATDLSPSSAAFSRDCERVTLGSRGARPRLRQMHMVTPQRLTK